MELEIEQIAVIVENKSQERKMVNSLRKAGIQRASMGYLYKPHYSYFRVVEGRTFCFNETNRDKIRESNLFPITLKEFIEVYIDKYEGETNEEN